MNVEVSTVMLKLIHDLYVTGLYGESIEAVARRLIEERLRELANSTLLTTGDSQ